MKTTLTERGQVSIPADLRRRLGLEPGTELDWEQIGPDDIQIHVIRPASGSRRAVACLGWIARHRKPRTTASWLEELREGEDAR